MKRKFLTCAVLVSGLAAGCTKSPLSPSELPSANGALPAWLFINNGHGVSVELSGRLVRPAAGTYGIYLPADIAADPEMSAHADRVLAAANDLAGRGGIRLIRSNDRNAALQVAGIDAAHPLATGALGWGTLYVEVPGRFICLGIRDIGFRDRQSFLNSVFLHEIGHFLFGPRHSDNPSDTMNPQRYDFQRISFSANEYDVWARSLQFPPGTTP